MNKTGRWVVAAIVPLLIVQGAWGAKAGDAGEPKIAVFRLSGAVTERPTDTTFAFGGERSISLKDLVARMKQARDDKNVKAVVLMLDGAQIGMAQIEELRQTIAQVRAADKDVYAHVDELSLGGYLLLSGASRISIVPTGDMWLMGLHAESPYLRGMLDKIGVVPDFLTCGAYKSASEILMRTGPSPQAEEMTNWLLDSMFDTAVKLIAEGRKVPPAKVKEWIDGAPYTAEKAVKLGIIDAVQHRQEFVGELHERFGASVKFDKHYGADDRPDLDFSSPFAIFNVFSKMLSGKEKSDKPAVGIVYVEGAISLGSDEPSPFGGSGGARSTSVRKALDKAADDDSIKAVVLRVDSPGGSAVASEIILDATKRVRAKKALVVSMGNVAGSGGYYVACGAETIFADAATITGSIGVVAGKLATTGMWNKVGINFKEYQRGANAALLSSARTFSDEERTRMQGWMDEIYGVFKGHVTEIRGKRLTKPIDDLAGGRVYTGQQALGLGLVDKIGTLDDAIKFAAAQANLGDYDIRVVPEPKNILEQIMEEWGNKEDEESSVAVRTGTPSLGEGSALFEAALPLIRHLDPQRLSAVLTALTRLEMLNHEGVVLMMPEIVVFH